MNWIWLSLVSVITLSISNILQRVLMKDNKSDAYAYSVVFQLTCAMLIGLFAFARGFTMPPIKELPVNFLIMAVLYGLGGVSIFKALQLLDVSDVTIISSVRTLVAIVSAVLFLGDSFTATQVLGVIGILSAVILVSWQKKGIVLNNGVWYAILMALCYGLAVTNDGYILRYSQDVISYTAICFLLPPVFLILIRPNVFAKIGFLKERAVCKRMILMSVIYSVSAITFFSAIGAGGAVSQVSPISQSSVVCTVILAALFLGERKHIVRKLLAAAAVCIGVFLVR